LLSLCAFLVVLQLMSDALAIPDGASGSRSPSPASRGRQGKQKLDLDQLQEAYEELVSFKKQDEKAKKDEERQKKLKLQNDKKTINKLYSQAQKTANQRQQEVTKLMRRLEKVEAEAEKQSAKKLMQKDKLTEITKKLREEQHHTEAALNSKIAEVSEASGRLHQIDWVLENLDQKGDGPPQATTLLSDEELREQEDLKEESQMLRTKNELLREENEELRTGLEQIRRAIQEKREEIAQRQASKRIGVQAGKHEGNEVSTEAV